MVQFPNYRQLLPDTVEHELRIASAELADVVRRVSLLAQKNAPLRLAFEEGQLTVSAQTPDVGEASEAIPVPYNGEPLIGFNPEFLRDGLESVDADFANVSFEEIKHYCGLELDFLSKALTVNRDGFDRLGIRLPHWTGAGAAAGAFIRANGIQEHYSQDIVATACRCNKPARTTPISAGASN